MTSRSSSNLSERPQYQTLFIKRRLQGWMMMEVILCLALLAVVLQFVQGQSETQWQAIQLMEEKRKIDENTAKQEAMVQLAKSSSWLNDSNVVLSSGYPDCLLCRGSQLKHWFDTSQHIVPSNNGGEE